MEWCWLEGERAASSDGEPDVDTSGALTTMGIYLGMDKRVTMALVPALRDNLVLSEIWPRVAVGVHAINSQSSSDEVQEVVLAMLSLRQACRRWCYVVDTSLEGTVVRTALCMFLECQSHDPWPAFLAVHIPKNLALMNRSWSIHSPFEQTLSRPVQCLQTHELYGMFLVLCRARRDALRLPADRRGACLAVYLPPEPAYRPPRPAKSPRKSKAG